MCWPKTSTVSRSAMNRVVKLTLLLVVCAAGVQAKEIRVGITEYQTVESAYKKYGEFFEALETIARQQKSDVTFRFAIGTYGEVVDWYNKKLIDVAVLSAMPIADLLTTSDPNEQLKIRNSFLAKLNPIPGRAVICTGNNTCLRTLGESSPGCVAPDSQSLPAEAQYHSAVVVPAEYGWKSFDDVRKYARQKKLKFLFVRPVSISGYIVPTYFLKQQGIDLKQEDFAFTNQHQESLQRMLRKDSRDAGKYVVAFVIENSSYCVAPEDSNKPLFTKLDTRDLDAENPDATGLGSIEIPHEVMLVNSNLEKDAVDDIKKTLLPLLDQEVKIEQQGKKKNFTLTLLDPAQVNWLNAYNEAKRIYESTRGTRALQHGSSFDELISSLKTYQQSTGEPPRLALVLSGGGAKCAYQAGAIAEIENKLQELKPELGAVDFQLVVGTSGGAINALLAALGGTRDQRTQESIKNMWTSFHQEQFFNPSSIFNIMFGLCFGLLQALCITFAVLLFGRRELRWKRIGQMLVGVEVIEICLAEYLGTVTSSFAIFVIAQVVVVVAIAAALRLIRKSSFAFFQTGAGRAWRRLYNRRVGDWWRIAGWSMLIISSIEILIARGVSLSQWPAILKSHVISHIWLVFLMICTMAYPWPLVLGLLMVASGIRGRLNIDWHSRRIWLVRMLAMLVVVFALILVLTSLWKDRSPSNSAQIEKAFIQKVPAMLEVLHPGFKKRYNNADLSNISKAISSDPSLLKRNLIITVSNLPLSDTSEESDDPQLVPANELPEDLYFYFKSPQVKWPPPPVERRFINFQENPDKLLDVVIGSGTIYPLFPSRELRSINLGQQKRTPKLKVIDGGFIHNSPVGAAVEWGATHIISIEASPLPKPFDPQDTFDNSLVAFNYIMAQAQRSDAGSRGQVEIFELRPRSECEKKNLERGCNRDPEPNMDTFDFDPDIVSDAFNAGQEDVRTDMPLFWRVPGPPRFRHTKQQMAANGLLAVR